MTRIAEILRKQLAGASPEDYWYVRRTVFKIFRDFESWFSQTDPDFLPISFHNLIFEGYPYDLYSGR
jgi:hypothetical protein